MIKPEHRQLSAAAWPHGRGLLLPRSSFTFDFTRPRKCRWEELYDWIWCLIEFCPMDFRYFRSGAPPVINPLHTRFPGDTVVPGSFTVTLTWTLPNRTTGAFNVTSPLPGDWFLAAHLPKDEGKISVKVSVNRQTLFC